MFEEEAEDKAFEKYPVPIKGDSIFLERNLKYEEGFKDGATFGYNKAKEEMQKNGLALQSDMDKTIEQNIALKTQIEKMKCCGNCIHEINEDEIIVQTGHCDNCFEFCNWKLRR